jgi:putative endonuclease
MTNSRQSLGRWGEALAAEYLCRHGYTILERNVRTPYGEIDLIASVTPLETPLGTYPGTPTLDNSPDPKSDPTPRASSEEDDPLSGDPPVTVFVEVKTRASRTYGLPEESVTSRKRAHLVSAAQAYLQQHPELDFAWRIDVIAIQCYHPDRPPEIHHFEKAIWE